MTLCIWCGYELPDHAFKCHGRVLDLEKRVAALEDRLSPPTEKGSPVKESPDPG